MRDLDLTLTEHGAHCQEIISAHTNTFLLAQSLRIKVLRNISAFTTNSTSCQNVGLEEMTPSWEGNFFNVFYLSETNFLIQRSSWLISSVDTRLPLYSSTEIYHLPATTGDFRSSRSWMEVLAVTTLLLLTVPIGGATLQSLLQSSATLFPFHALHIYVYIHMCARAHVHTHTHKHTCIKTHVKGMWIQKNHFSCDLI